MKRILRGTLILVIPSFVVFYGWSQLEGTGAGPNQEFAAVKEPTLLGFWPFQKWQPVTAAEMMQAGDLLMFRTRIAYQMSGMPYMPQGNPADLFSMGDILREAINLRIVRKQAEKLGIGVTDQDLKAIIQAQMRGLEDPEQFRQYLAMTGETEDSYLAKTANQEVYMRVMGTFLNRSKVSMFEIWQEYSLQKEKLQLDFVTIDGDKFAQAIPVDEKALEEYLKKNLAKYRIPDQRVYEYVAVSRDSIDQSTTISDADVRKFYDDNPMLFQTGKRVKVRQIKMALAPGQQQTPEMAKKMDEILAKVKAPGAKFQEIAADLSMDSLVADTQPTTGPTTRPTSGPTAGPEIWISQEDEATLGSAVVNAAMALEQKDQVSELTYGTDGIYILQAVEFEESKLKPFEGEVVDMARTQAKARAIADGLKQWTEKFQTGVKEQGTIADLAKTLQLEVKKTEPLNVSETTIDPGVGPLATDKEYLSMLEPTDPIAVLTTQSGVIALTIDEEKDAHDPKLAEVRAQVEEDYRNEEALKKAKELTDAGMKEAKSPEAFRAWAEKQGLRVRTTEPFERVSRPAEINEEIENFSNLTYKVPVGSVNQSTLKLGGSPTGYIIWRINRVEAPAIDQFYKERPEFERQLVMLKQWAMMDEWLSDARRDWKVRLPEVEG